MYQKKFVSIYFSANKIQVAKLNSKKTAVVKYATFDVPAGALYNHRVKDPKLLTGALKRIWDEMKLREKAVAIIVPEFATFTKTMTLPSLENRELDEAVRWQANDQLPFEKGKAILDWKLIKERENDKQVLLCAMSSDVLTGYVDAVSSAGLYPLSVETPSVTLVNLLNMEEKKRLIIYQGNAETILLITEGQSITGSSVLNTKDEEIVLNTAMQFIYHYSQGKIEQIFVGGLPFSHDFYPKLHQNLGGVQPQYLTLPIPIHGVTAEQMQEYLVPFSQQIEELQAPNDVSTINLLPSSWAKHYQDQLDTRQFSVLALFAACLVWAGAATVILVFIVLNTQLGSIKSAATANGSANEEVVAKVEETNAFIDKMYAISQLELYPQTYINAINKVKPSSIVINEYSVLLESGTAQINGLSPNRQELLTFKTQLEDSGEFAIVDIPISSLITAENSEFAMSFTKRAVQQKQAVPKLKI